MYMVVVAIERSGAKRSAFGLFDTAEAARRWANRNQVEIVMVTQAPEFASEWTPDSKVEPGTGGCYLPAYIR